MKTEQRTILITGNLGYVGPAVMRRLRSSYPDARLIGLDMGYFAHCLSTPGNVPEIVLDTQHYGDIRCVDEALLKGVDAVIHLAAISNDPMGNLYEQVTHEVNTRASVSLAAAAKRCGVKSFVYASSCSVYGFADDAPRSEASPVNPLTAYAKSKINTELELETLADSTFKVSCLRFATACGMSERLRLDLVLNDFVACAMTSKVITILSDGTPWRPLINIKDMAGAIDWAIQRPAVEGGDFLSVNVGAEAWNYRVKDLAEAVQAVIPGVDISINQDAPPDRRSYRVDFSRFNRLAPKPYHPQMDLTRTIQELRDGLQAMGFQDSQFRQSRYIRLYVLNALKTQGCLDGGLSWTSVANGRQTR